MAEYGSAENRAPEEWQPAGDPAEVLQDLFRAHYRRISYFFQHKGFSSEESRDLAQETFLRVHRGLAEFRGDSRIETWLFKIADSVYKNTLRSRLTQKRDAPELSLDLAVESHAEGTSGPAWESPEEGPLDGILAEERVRVLRDALEDLPVQMRRCVELRVDRDLKYREIAELMHISIDTVKAHLYQARQQLKVKLDKYFREIDLGEE